MPGDKEKCLNAGMNNYIAKPINPDYLAKILEKLKNNVPADNQYEEAENEPERFAGSATDLVLDRERVIRIFAKKITALEKIFKACRKTVEKNLQQAQRAIEKESSAELVKAFHTIKGSLGNLGGNESANLAEQIENAADSADFEKASLLIPEFKDSLNRFIDELADLLKELKQT
jgi:HPt (histidine-containing phosphotransfer) domain-containing protein